MKNTLKIAFLLFATVIMIFSVTACKEKAAPIGLWESADYLSDKTLGEGKNTVTVEIVADEQSIVLTVKTDKDTLGEALYYLGIINDPSFFDTCNGIKADWDKHMAYWSFCKGEEKLTYGVGDEKATTSGDAAYRIVYKTTD